MSEEIKYIDLDSYPVSDVLDILLLDRTTGKNIIFATDDYKNAGYSIDIEDEITKELLSSLENCEIQPRVLKSKENQAQRTKAKAEVFTPSWICNKMNNYCDEDWLGGKYYFNIENEQSWVVNYTPVDFPEGKTFEDYVLSKRLEITCGEAPS